MLKLLKILSHRFPNFNLTIGTLLEETVLSTDAVAND